MTTEVRIWPTPSGGEVHVAPERRGLPRTAMPAGIGGGRLAAR